MSSSYLKILDDMEIVNFDDLKTDRYRARTRLVLNSFDEVVQIPGPNFVFLHLIIPHGPFTFDENGNAVPVNIDFYAGAGHC